MRLASGKNARRLGINRPFLGRLVSERVNIGRNHFSAAGTGVDNMSALRTGRFRYVFVVSMDMKGFGYRINNINKYLIKLRIS